MGIGECDGNKRIAYIYNQNEFSKFKEFYLFRQFLSILQILTIFSIQTIDNFGNFNNVLQFQSFTSLMFALHPSKGDDRDPRTPPLWSMQESN